MDLFNFFVLLLLYFIKQTYSGSALVGKAVPLSLNIAIDKEVNDIDHVYFSKESTSKPLFPNDKASLPFCYLNALSHQV